MPVVVFEHCRLGFGPDMTPFLDPPDFETTQAIYLLLADLGYRIYALDGNGPLGAERLRQVYEIADEINFLARP
jgi:hypothetical protein